MGIPILRASDSLPLRESGIQLENIGPEYIRDLALLCKIWGFLKYHHPQVASGAFNWDHELFKIMKHCHRINTQHRDRDLLEWIDGLGVLPDCWDCKKKPKEEIVLSADLRWIDDEALSPALRHRLKEVYQNRDLHHNHYVDFVKGVKNPVFTNEAPYKDLNFPDAGFRLLALFRFWNIVQYFYPYRDVIGEDWEAVLLRYIPKMLALKNSLEYKLMARELFGTIHDSHANLWMTDPELQLYFGTMRPPVQVRFVQKQLTVTGFYQTELAKNFPLQPGDVITHIRAIPVDTLMARKRHLYPASNEAAQRRDMAIHLLRSNDPELPVTVLRKQDTISLNIPCYDPRANKYRREIDSEYYKPDSCYRLLTPDIGYLYLGNIQSELLPGIVKKFKNTKGLIIDIRNYPSEFVVYTLVDLLKKEESPFVYFTYTTNSHPGTFVRTAASQVGGAREAYQGQILLLVNEVTQSQAEYTAMALRSIPGALVMGSTTAGADGNVSEFSLPGGLETMISGIGIFYPDGKPTQRVGIVPDIWAEPTVAGIGAGRDEVLEKAIEWINKH
jgi:C-terminal processing protease CtpA/Prc